MSEQTAQERILAEMRMRILDGTYPPGTRLTELGTAEDLGVSRTPIRAAIRALAKEGFLDRSGARGYAVRQVRPEDMRHALQVRGVLEGEAVRRLAGIGLKPTIDRKLSECLEEEARLFQEHSFGPDFAAAYNRLNTEFHSTLHRACDSPQLEAAIRQMSNVPSGMIHAIKAPEKESSQEYVRLLIAHTQHQVILRAIRNGDGVRAEEVMREHAFVRIDYAELVAETLAGAQVTTTSAKDASDDRSAVGKRRGSSP
ncbi:GntR family transcriptional regulator [Tropicibacter alexandrii]|uniref:GntR family transcriptional regulator n=1 Tax=Tropicibacter alexandrii TaxID=2267683 RepID=UPI000EF4E4C6|nr:GntR family transcriptional regulator [Tropicibacter alexandrii]